MGMALGAREVNGSGAKVTQNAAESAASLIEGLERAEPAQATSALRHLTPIMPASRRAGLLAAGCVSVTGITSLIVSRWPASTLFGSIMIVLAAAGVIGGLFALLVVIPEGRRRLDRVTLVGRIRVLSAPTREQSFATLTAIDSRHELAPIARAVLDVLLATHHSRMEASWLRREMDSEISRQTRKRTAMLARMSQCDGLTGLLNRRGFDEEFEQMFARAAREGEDLAVIAMDMDMFKSLNDTCGHAKGDEALKVAGQILRSQLRDHDIAGRLGGDELVIVLYGADSSGARTVAERIASLFNTHPLGVGLPCPWPSLSAGIATRLEHAPETTGDLLEKADRALYQSKQGGRRRCTVFGQDAPAARVA